MKLSIIIPVRDEQDSIKELYNQLVDVLSDYEHEIIFIDDGSKDGTLDELRCHTNAKTVVFRRNFGKSAAMMAGFKEATGDVIFTMDGDLQDDPAEIPNFLTKLDEGFDLVVGWKKVRRDPISKTVPSKFFNWLTTKLTGVRVHDSNCGFKCFRREVIDNLEIHGELHRYVPSIVHQMGFNVGEIPVEHHARKYGRSKYGLSRLIKGFLDLMTVTFIMQYRFRPAHLFGQFGLVSLSIGALAGLLTVYRFFTSGHVSAPAIMTALFTLTGVLFILHGLLAELVINKDSIKQYQVKEVIKVDNCERR